MPTFSFIAFDFRNITIISDPPALVKTAAAFPPKERIPFPSYKEITFHGYPIPNTGNGAFSKKEGPVLKQALPKTDR